MFLNSKRAAQLYLVFVSIAIIVRNTQPTRGVQHHRSVLESTAMKKKYNKNNTVNIQTKEYFTKIYILNIDFLRKYAICKKNFKETTAHSRK